MSLPIAGAATALNVLPEDPNGPLTSNSSLIQKTREKLQKIFFKEGSVLFVSPKEEGLSLFVYPRLNTVYTQLGRESTIHLSIELCEVNKNHLQSHYMRDIGTSVNNLLMIVKTHDPLKNIIISKIDQADSSNLVMKWIITFQQFIQFVSSLLYLYKDVIDYIQRAEEDLSVKRLKKMLKSFLVQSHRDQGCNGDVLRELLISQSKQLSLDLAIESEYKEFLIKKVVLAKQKYKLELEINLVDIISKHGSEDDIVRLMINVSIEDYKTCRSIIRIFISEYVTHSMWQCVLKKRSEEDLIVLVKFMPRVMLREMSQDMLQSILIKMSTDDLVKIIRLFPITLLKNVLMQLCPDLLRQVLLEIPEDVLRDLQDELPGSWRLKHFQERIQELHQIKTMHQGSKEDNIPIIPSLLALSATIICRSSSLSLGGAQGLGGWPYNPLYVNRLVEPHLELKEDINKLARMSIEPSLEGVSEIIFGDRQSVGYSSSDDLLSLASMMPGYDNHIKQALLKNAK